MRSILNASPCHGVKQHSFNAETFFKKIISYTQGQLIDLFVTLG